MILTFLKNYLGVVNIGPAALILGLIETKMTECQ